MTEKRNRHPDWEPAHLLSDALPVKLLRAREAIMQFYRPLFRKSGITERQWRVLRNLYDEDFLEPSELAKRAYMQPPNVSRVLSELRKRGYIERIAVDGDQRRAQVKLTDSGRVASAMIGRRIDDRTAELRAMADEAQLEKLAEALDMAIGLPLDFPRLTTSDD